MGQIIAAIKELRQCFDLAAVLGPSPAPGKRNILGLGWGSRGQAAEPEGSCWERSWGGAAKESQEALEMAVLQADKENYSTAALMSCHLHLSRGILHAQSHSPLGTSQEIRDVNGWDTQPKTQPLPGQRSTSIHHVPP